MGWWLLGGGVVLLVVWARRRRRRRQEGLAGVDFYRGGRWQVRGGERYWRFELSQGARAGGQPREDECSEKSGGVTPE